MLDDFDSLSHLFQSKLIIYDICSTDELKCQIINFGFRKRIYLARYLNYFYVVAKTGT